MERYLGIDCGSVSLNLALMTGGADEPVSVYLRTKGRPLGSFVEAIDELIKICDGDLPVTSALVTGSARELLSKALNIPAINEISAHATGAHHVIPNVRTIIEIGGQDSKFVKIEPSVTGGIPHIQVFRMNEICAAGTGAFLDEQAERLGIGVESFGALALQSIKPAPIAGRCAVFAKTDMIHQAQEGTPIPDILLGLAFALARNYVATLIRGDTLVPVVSLQGGVMSNQAVVHAFQKLLNLEDKHVVISPHYKVLGALGCAVLTGRQKPLHGLSLETLKAMADRALRAPSSCSFFDPLDPSLNSKPPAPAPPEDGDSLASPLVMGLDVGSVSVKGVILDATGRIIREDYRLSRSRPLEALTDVIASLAFGEISVAAIAVTGSGRYLAGRLLDADLIVNEITAQAAAALSYDSEADTVVEIGGQDSKWISLEEGQVQDFEMNRVCAAGTGSFLMAQAQRLDLPMGDCFSDAAFSSQRPADLGNRCTVFMESDLIHHQNSGASSADLAAGVCISIVHNYLERVANHKPLGKRVVFMGGVAATPAVKAAFEQQTLRKFETPAFFRVSGAVGAALKALEKLERKVIVLKERPAIQWNLEEISKEQFTCKGCTNQCRINKYRSKNRNIFHGGLCDRWEADGESASPNSEPDLFSTRARLLLELSEHTPKTDQAWAIVQSPQFYEWFPFWKAFCEDLGISLLVSPSSNRKQFESGSCFLRVETCLPMKVMAGQIEDLVNKGARTLFHPAILSELSPARGDRPLDYCPFIQASSQFFRGAFDIEWKEPVVNCEIDPDAFRKEHVSFARSLGFSHHKACSAFNTALEHLEEFQASLRREGERFVNSLGKTEPAIVVLGKPYHTSDPFLNMNLGSLFHRLGIRAIPGDLYPLRTENTDRPVSWKYQGNLIQIARAIAGDPRMFPVLTTFFGCGPDAFTLRHIREILASKPMLVLEMDEHSSRAGIITRLEAFLDRVNLNMNGRKLRADQRFVSKPHDAFEESKALEVQSATVRSDEPSSLEFKEESHSYTGEGAPQLPIGKHRPLARKAEVVYVPFMGDHAYGFAAAARSVGIDARVLPPPDEESERLGRPHMVSGECHPYALVLGDYLKLAQGLSAQAAQRSLFYMFGPDACRLGQFPTYIDKVRRELGFTIGVIRDVDEGIAAFGVSPRYRQQVLLRVWEGLNAYDVLLRLFLQIRPLTQDQALLERVYIGCRDKLYKALSEGGVRAGMEEILHDLHAIPVEDADPRPVVAVTGDYYTRIVPYANNDVYKEIEALGGTLWSPPTFSDSYKLGTLRDFIWSVLNGRSRSAAEHGIFYTLMTISEFKVKSLPGVRRALNCSTDLLGLNMWKKASRHAHSRLPAGITAPLATALNYLDQGADGVLNLMTLNCSYGTVVTAALLRALKKRPGTPLLTLVFDGLKKTNDKTRLEAFMEQVQDRFQSKLGDCGKRSVG